MDTSLLYAWERPRNYKLVLYFWFRPQREPLDIIEVWLSVVPSIVIENVTECHYWSRSTTFFIMAQLN